MYYYFFLYLRYCTVKKAFPLSVVTNFKKLGQRLILYNFVQFIILFILKNTQSIYCKKRFKKENFTTLLVLVTVHQCGAAMEFKKVVIVSFTHTV